MEIFYFFILKVSRTSGENFDFPDHSKVLLIDEFVSWNAAQSLNLGKGKMTLTDTKKIKNVRKLENSGKILVQLVVSRSIVRN